MTESEAIQGLIVRTLATNPAGHRLCLIGGFRYRLLDGSARRSVDVDYHWEGDLVAKQREVIDRVIDEQLDAAVAANVKAAGGGVAVLDAVLELVDDRLRGTKDVQP